MNFAPSIIEDPAGVYKGSIYGNKEAKYTLERPSRLTFIPHEILKWFGGRLLTLNISITTLADKL